VFLALIGLQSVLQLQALPDQILRLLVMTLVLWLVARPVLDFKVQNVAGSVLLGVGVFAVWIGPDMLFPAYRHHWLFDNAIMGAARTSLSAEGQGQPLVLALRTLRAVAIVPIVEELFWRAWLMRWLITPDFRKTPLGSYTPVSFWIVAILFASEHGSYWDVGLAAGILYNWWMIRTKSLGNLILAHAVTNACLSLYVIQSGKWEYWL
jgi:CAAX prenyl protease-like protein